MKSEIAIAIAAICAVLIAGWFSRTCQPEDRGITIGTAMLVAGCRTRP